MTGTHRISIVIPTLNEVRRIRGHLEALAGRPAVHEIVVVDAHSTDGTAAAVSACGPRVRLLCAGGGRGPQLNAGARVATGDVLLFLHADVRLPEDFAAHVARTLQDPQTVAGAFLTRTHADGQRTALARLLWLADLRSRYTRLPYGDQALFVRAAVFHAVGGFPSLPLLEDLELSRRLARVGRIRTVRACVEVSGRRFLRRPIYNTALVNLCPLLFRLGISAERLAQLYGAPR